MMPSLTVTGRPDLQVGSVWVGDVKLLTAGKHIANLLSRRLQRRIVGINAAVHHGGELIP
jgi:hypothetical protein